MGREEKGCFPVAGRYGDADEVRRALPVPQQLHNLAWYASAESPSGAAPPEAVDRQNLSEAKKEQGGL